MPEEKKPKKENSASVPREMLIDGGTEGKALIEKKVKQSGNSGRVYLPPNWVGHDVKII